MKLKTAVTAMAILLFILNVTDYLVTMWMLSLGGVELNPIMAPIISTPLAPFLKIILVGIVCYLVARYLRFKPGVAVLAVVTSIYVLIISWNFLNVAVYYIVTWNYI